ncbi:histidinol-phosphate aminotransferase family protein [candidate division WWE3 bacterium]|nr:histidinol-phosphate aminotransferase family protein [candidate division WWE3 bacterium]
MKKRINYLKSISYPEYAAQNGHGDIQVNLGLTDLSFNDGQKVTEKVLKILSQGKNYASKYNFSQNSQLKSLIARYLELGENTDVVMTAGGDGGLNIVSRAFIGPDTRVAIPLPSFGRFEYHTKINKGKIYYMKPSKFPYDIQLDEMIRLCRNKHIDVLFLANPNNPTGIFKPVDKIELLLKKFRGILILDEALADYTGTTAAPLIEKYPNLIIVRSFSKLFGLAGMRVGYVVAHKTTIDGLGKLVSPFEVNSIATQIAIELMSEPDEFADKKREELLKSLKTIWKFKHPNIQSTPTQSSVFLLKSDTDKYLYDLLLSNSIKTVSSTGFRGLENENCVRVSIKDYASTKRLFSVLESI